MSNQEYGKNARSQGNTPPFFSPSLSSRAGGTPGSLHPIRRVLKTPKPISKHARRDFNAENPSNATMNVKNNDSEPIESAPEAEKPCQETEEIPEIDQNNARAVIRQQLDEMRRPQQAREAGNSSNDGDSGDYWIHRLRGSDGNPTIQFPGEDEDQEKEDDDDKEASRQTLEDLHLTRQDSRVPVPPTAQDGENTGGSTAENEENEDSGPSTPVYHAPGSYEDITRRLLANILHFQVLQKRYGKVSQPEQVATFRCEVKATDSMIKSLVDAGRRLLAEMTPGGIKYNNLSICVSQAAESVDLGVFDLDRQINLRHKAGENMTARLRGRSWGWKPELKGDKVAKGARKPREPVGKASSLRG